MPPTFGNASMRAKANLAKAESAAKAPPARIKTTKSKATLSKDTVSDSDYETSSSEPESDAEDNSIGGRPAKFNMNLPFIADHSDSDHSLPAPKHLSNPQNQFGNRSPSSRSPSPEPDDGPSNSGSDTAAATFNSNPFQEAEAEAAAERALSKPRSLNARRLAATEKRAAKLLAKKSGTSVKTIKGAKTPAAIKRKTLPATSTAATKGRTAAKAHKPATQTPKAKATPKAAGRRRVNKEAGGELSLNATLHPASHAPDAPKNPVSEARVLSLPKPIPAAASGVLVRGTARALQWRKRNGELFQTLAVHAAAAWIRGPTILELPDEVRDRIWKFAVVEPVVYIWPANLVGREQPDLSKVSRQVRWEVLQVFYGENVWAVDVSPGKTLSGTLTLEGDFTGIDKWATGLIVRKWGSDESWDQSVGTEWFGFIRQWVFPCELGGPQKVFGAPETACVVSVTSPPPNKVGNAKVEVHRDAVCLLPAIEDHKESCAASDTPGWLSQLADEAGLGRDDIVAMSGQVKRRQIADFAKALRKQATRLMHARCEKVLASTEIEAGGETMT